MFCGPHYKTVNSVTKKIYISDYDAGKLICLKPNGKQFTSLMTLSDVRAGYVLMTEATL